MTDYKKLCVELLDAIDHFPGWIPPGKRPVIGRARAALAETEPEGPTDEELDLLADCHMITDGETGAVSLEHLDYARAVLARWGNHPEFPDSSTLHPVPVSERLPVPGDCDEKGRCWWWYPEVPGKTYGYWAYEDDAVPERALNEQPTHWLPAYALPHPS